MPDVRELLNHAVYAHQSANPVLVLEITQSLLNSGVTAPGMRHLRSLALSQLARFPEALAEVKAEVAANPQNAAARAEEAALTRLVESEEAARSANRTFGTALPRETALLLERACFKFHYKGVQLVKDPFDFALYSMLLWQTRPRTILEIGSAKGGSALWMADMLGTYGVEEPHIYSVDVVQVTDVSHPRITFLQGNGRALNEVFTEEFLAALPRPWLVVEDADHSFETSTHVLEFFHRRQLPGEYIVIEDGLSAAGPRQALAQFLPRHPGEYEIDVNYCDFFGFNTTWCVNGYLRRGPRNGT